MSHPRPDRGEPPLFAQHPGRRRLARSGGPMVTRAQDEHAGEATFDVALDGATVRSVKARSGHPSDLPMTGDTFMLFGNIFPAGTFDTGNLNPG